MTRSLLSLMLEREPHPAWEQLWTGSVVGVHVKLDTDEHKTLIPPKSEPAVTNVWKYHRFCRAKIK